MLGLLFSRPARAILSLTIIKELFKQAERKVKKAERALSKVEESLNPADHQDDPESLSDEERFMFRKLGLRMKAFLLLGEKMLPRTYLLHLRKCCIVKL